MGNRNLVNSIKGHAALTLGFVFTALGLFLLFGDGFTWGPLYSSDRRDGGAVILLLFGGFSSFAVGIAELHINKATNSEDLADASQTKTPIKSDRKDSDPLGKFYEFCLWLCFVWFFYVGYQLLNTGVLPQGKSGDAFEVQLTGFSKYLIGSILMVPLCVLVVSKIKKYKKL